MSKQTNGNRQHMTGGEFKKLHRRRARREKIQELRDIIAGILWVAPRQRNRRGPVQTPRQKRRADYQERQRVLRERDLRPDRSDMRMTSMSRL